MLLLLFPSYKAKLTEIECFGDFVICLAYASMTPRAAVRVSSLFAAGVAEDFTEVIKSPILTHASTEACSDVLFFP